MARGLSSLDADTCRSCRTCRKLCPMTHTLQFSGRRPLSRKVAGIDSLYTLQNNYVPRILPHGIRAYKAS
ncbi:hypothetical protein K445DRAFT_320783 [Daldinia sp. EC12]|nr:hypothetical protein K445DRAFT_320783 [Daldinia sp. EC12]